MTVTLAYDTQLSRVRITADGLGNADTALVERSTNQVTWSTVRGGAAAAVASGALAVAVDDYEFAPSVTNYYRVTRAADITFVAAGAAAHANNASVTPGLPAGHTAGDLLLIWAAIHNSGTGTPNTPAGYQLLLNASNARLFGKLDNGSEAAPTVSFANGAAGPTSAQMAAFRNVPLSVAEFADQLNSSAQNVAYPALDPSTVHSLLLYLGWKRNNWTSVATLTGDGGTAAEIGDPTTFQSSVGQGLVWDYVIQNTTEITDVAAGSFVVTGGSSDISRGAVASIAANLHQQTNSITPVLTDVWIKDIAKPFLNRAVKPLKYISWERRARGGVFDVVGRSLPVAVTDIRSGRENFTLQVLVDSTQERDDLDLAFASGDPIFMHCPPDYPVRSMYVFVGDTRFDEFRGVLTLPLTEVAAPAPEVVGATNTYQSILNSYATYTALLAGESTYKDVVQRIGSPADVIVP